MRRCRPIRCVRRFVVLSLLVALAGMTGTAGMPATQGAPPPVTTQAGAAPPAPTFRVDTDLVVVDLVPTDKQGRFIADLRPEEIRISERGQPWQVQFVQHVRAGRPSARTPAAGSAATPPAERPPSVPATGYESRMLQLVDQLDDIAQFTDNDPTKAIGLATTMGRNVIMETHRELSDLSQSLAALARMVSPLPGRKHVVV